MLYSKGNCNEKAAENQRNEPRRPPPFPLQAPRQNPKMSILFTSLLYGFLFIVLYFEVFLILTLIENRKSLGKSEHLELDGAGNVSSANGLNGTSAAVVYPSVTIIVPAFNEERTVVGTIHSLLKLNYPKEKLSIMVVDDGSKDGTWNTVQQFAGHPQVILHKKVNGGKYTVLNYAIERCTTEFIGCLDADSFVDSEALMHIIPQFKDTNVMAVTPSLKIQNPKTVLGMMQNAEYNLVVFVKKILGLLDAQYVTPGPFSIFRKEVFNIVGPYRHAHNSEDLEIAFRLQERHYKIQNAHKAIVYTVGPRTVYALYKQRVRWTGGFFQNIIDYRRLMFKRKYGTFGMMVLPVTAITSLGSFFLLMFALFSMSQSLIKLIQHISLVGFNFSWPPVFTRDWLLFNVQASMLFSVISIGLVLFSIWYGRKLSGGKRTGVLDTFYFLTLYSVISPFWLVTSVYNTVTQRDAVWR